MKKIYVLLLVASIFSNQLFAQDAHSSSLQLPVGREINKSFSGLRVHQPSPNANRSLTDRWYNFGDAMAQYVNLFFSETSMLYGNNLFPDSTILVDYGSSGYLGTWIHNLGDLLDVKSQFFNDPTFYPNELYLTQADTFRLDSIDFYFIYTRNITSVVDTLVFDIKVNSNLTTNYFLSPVATNLNTDTVFIKNIPYTYQTNTLNQAGKATYKIPLDDATYSDSLANGIHHVMFATTGLPVCNAGSLVVSSVRFVPGYTWIPNQDTLARMNGVFFVTQKEKPGASPPTTFSFPEYTKRDYNISYIVPQSVRYNVDAVGWNGFFIPSFAYMGGASSTYAYEHHAIYYKICVSNCGTLTSTNDIESSTNALNVYQNQPNPFSNNSVINYELPKLSNVSLEIYDITQRKLAVFDEGKQASGKHSITIDANRFADGVYLYTLKAGDISVTKRMIVGR